MEEIQAVAFHVERLIEEAGARGHLVSVWDKEQYTQVVGCYPLEAIVFNKGPQVQVCFNNVEDGRTKTIAAKSVTLEFVKRMAATPR